MFDTKTITALTLAISMCAFAGQASAQDNPPLTNTAQPVVSQTLTPYKTAEATQVAAPKTKSRRITRIVVEPVEAPVARKASTADHSRFVYKYGKNTPTKTFRPPTPKAESMPNLFKN